MENIFDYKDTYWCRYSDYDTTTIHITDIIKLDDGYKIICRAIYNQIHNNTLLPPGITTRKLEFQEDDVEEVKNTFYDSRYFQVDKDTYDNIMELYKEYNKSFHNIARKMKKIIKNKIGHEYEKF